MSSSSRLTLVLGSLLSIIVPLGILNMPLFKGLSNVELFSYGLGFCLVIATAVVTLLTLRDREMATSLSGIEVEVSHLRRSIREGRNSFAYVVGREELYKVLAGFVRNGKQRIDLMYQAPKPPLGYRKSDAKIKYLEALDSVVMAGKVPIRRIVLLTSENKAWVRELVEKYRGRATVSLALIVEQVHFPVISVQLVDRTRTVLVNLIGSSAGLGPRDVVLDSEELARIFEWYYEALFDVSEKIVENGQVRDDTLQQYLG